ncbi:uncharacterized protein LOC133841320 [Drosophila sulfurigaster albostrigata]|uniref:uncharacterized protein LOC133841320 n=1 Tax=Drosophila sulfurigaster albostrigata TaxID=89887 RepID=UPI002D21C726|nr:uncharacterized protein LOC133841320 [Drosophila sulfurigaster albostrigata]XP_062129699.1 uncharacterized protein LOC133841320 [Drosophila sulfurigaster albostrigata]
MTSDVQSRQTKSNLPLDQDNAANCKVCDAPFKTLQECLAHELLKHTIKPQKKLRKCLDAVTKLFASEQTQSERRLLEALLVQSPPGQQLRAVLGFYAGNSAALAECFQEVRKNIQNELQGKVKVYPFGSLVTGLALKDSDIDLYLESIHDNSNAMSHSQLYKRTNSFLRRPGCFSDVIAIRHARVPIIRCKHVASGLRLDISMSNPNSTHNSRFVAELLNRDVRLREMFLFLKIWAKKLMIIGNVMTSYCLITLIIYQLQQQRHLPSIKDLQSGIPVLDIGGINFAYSFEHVPALPASLTAFDLVSGFFELYSHMDFEKKMLSPYLGHALDVEAAFTVPGNFPEYNAQLLAIETAMQERIEPFNIERCVCVQDPFELSRNVGQSISQTNLYYLNQCLAAANEACNDAKLKSTPPKFYDYLLFGLAEHLVEEHRLEHVHPAKQRKKMPKKEDAVAVEAKADVASTTVAAKADEPSVIHPSSKDDRKPTVTDNSCMPLMHVYTLTPTNNDLKTLKADFLSKARNPSSKDDRKPTITDNSCMPLMHVYTLTPTNNDLKTLKADFLSKARKQTKSIYYFWAECYVDAIKDILSHIYALSMKELDANVPATDTNALPQNISWQISTTLDTWSARNFQRSTRQSFFAQQLQQTVEFSKTRPQNPSYVVNMRGHLSLIIAEDYKELRLELQPMPGDALGLQRLSPLTKFFKSLKNMLCNYNFKEKVISFQYER